MRFSPRCIDQTLLRPEAAQAEVEKFCREAVQAQFAAVCVLPCWVSLADRLCVASATVVCTVVGFPLGGNSLLSKLTETAESLSRGVREIDLVINLGWLKSGAELQVAQEIAAVAELVHQTGSSRLLKVIIETCWLTEREKQTAALLAEQAGADMIKTSTGFGSGGATVEDVRLLRRVLAAKTGIKAAGGVRTLTQALSLLEAGADRIGTSAGLTLLREWRMADGPA